MAMELAQAGNEFAAENPAEDFDREEEMGACGDPAGMIGSQTAGRNYAMDMRMMAPALTIP